MVTLLELRLTQLTGIVLLAKNVSIQARVDAGEYYCKDYRINDTNFFVTLDAGPADLWTVWFGDGVNMRTEEVEAWAAARGYEVALVEELLAVGSHSEHRKIQLELSIIALGSLAVVDGSRKVSVLGRQGFYRGLGLDCPDDEWLASCCFLLRKLPVPSAT